MRSTLGRLEFGGPDLPARYLRDLLQARIDAAPSGSRIDWATYYFRDSQLAEALIRASDRGVRVRLALEFNPRRRGANDRVIEMLGKHGLGGGFCRYVRERRRGHLHAKVYAFSDPDIAFVGSFNPSGEDPEWDVETVEEIGDQDRGDNLLLAIERPPLTAALRRFVDHLADQRGKRTFALRSLPTIRDSDTSIYFYPRLFTWITESAIAGLGKGDRVRAAISHMKGGPLTFALALAARRGASVEVLVHATERRVPTDTIAGLKRAGVSIERIDHPDKLPMHAKFILSEHRGRHEVWLGSYNFNNRSRRSNAELLLRTSDSEIFETLVQRFDVIRGRSG